ncbi:MAG: TRAP transporter large permease subunit [Azospirillaceae bacterium]
MSIELLSLALFGLVLLGFALGTPVGFTLGGVAMAVAAVTWGPQAFNLIANTAQSSLTNFVLLAIPLFIMMGQVLVRSGLGEAMFHAMHVIAGRMRGGLAIGVIVVCSLIGAMVGIIGAGIMMAGSLALPAMLKRGYDKSLALGVVMAGGGLGILIPPSVPMIIFSAATNTSVGQLFAGALIPAAITIVLMIIYIIVYCRLRPEAGPARAEKVTRRDVVLAARDGSMSLALILLVLGSILGGFATPTEAGAVGALGAAVIAILYGRFGLGVISDASFRAMLMTAAIAWIILGASVFSNFHLLMGAARTLRSLGLDAGLSPFVIILLMQLTMLLLGFIIDELIIVIICAPLFTPIAVGLGYDPVWFGILMILNMEIAIMTPPYGFALFYLRAVAPPGVTMLDIYKSVWPFVLIKLVALVVCMVFPSTITFLPELLFR